MSLLLKNNGKFQIYGSIIIIIKLIFSRGLRSNYEKYFKIQLICWWRYINYLKIMLLITNL